MTNLKRLHVRHGLGIRWGLTLLDSAQRRVKRGEEKEDPALTKLKKGLRYNGSRRKEYSWKPVDRNLI